MPTVGNRGPRDARMVGVGPGLVAAAPPVRAPAFDARPVWVGLAWVLALVAAAVVAFGLAAWWQRRRAGHRFGPNEQLAHFRSLYERGELSSEEFDRVRAVLQERLVRELEVPANPETTTPSKPPPDAAGDPPAASAP